MPTHRVQNPENGVRQNWDGQTGAFFALSRQKKADSLPRNPFKVSGDVFAYKMKAFTGITV
jgi:hypothetical protein